jgi:hypothetical protein
MWRRSRRRSFAPRRPLAFAEQAGLILVVVLAVALGLAAAWLMFR